MPQTSTLIRTADEGDEPACFLVRGGEDLDEGARHGRFDLIRSVASRRILMHSHLQSSPSVMTPRG